MSQPSFPGINLPNTPKLPNTGTQNAQPATLDWVASKNAEVLKKQSIDTIMGYVNAHFDDYMIWMKNSQTGTLAIPS